MTDKRDMQKLGGSSAKLSAGGSAKTGKKDPAVGGAGNMTGKKDPAVDGSGAMKGKDPVVCGGGDTMDKKPKPENKKKKPKDNKGNLPDPDAPFRIGSI